MAQWTAAYVNDLPDSAFLYIEPGGTKDEDGRTVPRSLRHFPVRDASGAVDMPHLRNALARIPQSNLPQSVKDRCIAKGERLMESNRDAALAELAAGYQVRSADAWPDADFEVRAVGETGLTLEGLASVYEVPSLPLPIRLAILARNTRSYPPAGTRTFREVFHPGAWTKTLASNPDVTLRWQHDLHSLPLGRTKAGTLRLSEDTRGLRVGADMPDNEWGRPIRDSIRRGDVDGMSVAFRSVVEDWQQDEQGAVRHIYEAQLSREISITAYPAVTETQVSVRAIDMETELDAVREAFRVLDDPDGRLTTEQRDLLVALINSHTDEPIHGPRLARARERLAVLTH